jgi:hypothetical protein
MERGIDNPVKSEKASGFVDLVLGPGALGYFNYGVYKIRGVCPEICAVPGVEDIYRFHILTKLIG